uniref:Uncharacterized protein n=1 Tax=viral metagenome TaxID=1070528 RepID=A0A6C0KCT3_9ZZZZ
MFSSFIPKVLFPVNEKNKLPVDLQECQTCRQLRAENSVLRKQIEELIKEKLRSSSS